MDRWRACVNIFCAIWAVDCSRHIFFLCFFLRSRVIFSMAIGGHVPLRIGKKKISGSTWPHHQGNCSWGTWTPSVTKKNGLDLLGIGDDDIVLFAYLFVGRLDFPLGPYPKRERGRVRKRLSTPKSGSLNSITAVPSRLSHSALGFFPL